VRALTFFPENGAGYREKERVFFWKMMQYLNEAKRSGDAAALLDARGSLEMLAAHGADPFIRERARIAAQPPVMGARQA